MQAPRLWPINGPVMDAFDFVVTFADGQGGIRDDTLERFFRTPKGQGLSPTMKRKIWLWVPKMIQTVRQHQAEELEKIRNKK